MDLLATILTVAVVVVLALPVVMLALTVFVLMPLAHLMPQPAMVSRASFDCPFSRRTVNVAFLSTPQTATPSDVLACSRFSDERGIRCKKECLGMAETGWAPSPVLPRYALLADDVAFRG